MKKSIFLSVSFVLVSLISTAQNTFPATGNVGIGTTNPIRQLHLNKSSGSIYQLLQSGSNFLGIGLNNAMQYGPTFVFHENSQFRIGKASGISSSGATNFAEFLRISNAGNVGIGTTTPDSKLAVNGKIHAKEVKVDLSGWPDYVFEKDYNLPSLQEVENHIVQKGHLPNIPSASEVEKDGIQLGEMNAKLLQKIEELTLYMIAQNKKTEQLQKEIELLKKKMK